MAFNINVTIRLSDELSEQVDDIIDLLSQTERLEELAGQLAQSNDFLEAAVRLNTPKEI